MVNGFHDALAKSPIIAILRHLAPSNAVAVGKALLGAGISILEIPLNGTDAWETLAKLSEELGEKALIGAGTVLSGQDVGRVSARGGKFILSPNADPEIITVTKRLGMASVPGVATPSEAFMALKHGASALKLFPGQIFTPEIIKALRTVLPVDTSLVMSGGIKPENIKSYLEAGVKGFGVTSAIFQPDMSPEEVGRRAKKLVSAVK
jgi:2-dehydro-3-deoxyphosphogalactonate aldolase